MQYLDAIAHLSQADPMMAQLIERMGACTLHQEPLTGELLHELCETIIYQQLSGKAAATIHRRFLQLYPDKAHPTAAEILSTSDEVLRSAGVSRSKALYLKDLARHVLEGLPDLATLEAMEDEAIIQQLTVVKGIGRWTVQMLLMFRLQRLDVLPVDDLGIRAGAKRVYGLPELPNKKTLEQLAEPWRPYRTIACWYLWRSVDTSVRATENG
jgi:DNA-3-methyladenine glycosylase II